MSGANKIPLSRAQALADKLKKALEPACDRIMVAGSIRRQKTMIGDIELVCIPHLDTDTAVQVDMFGEVTGQTVKLTNHLDNRLAELLKLSPEHPPIFRSVADLVAAAKELHRPAPAWAGEDLKRWGEKYKRFYVPVNDGRDVVAVDLFITTRDSWGAIFALRTGPDDFSRALVTHIRYRTNYLQEDGCLVRKFSKQVVPVPTETEYFDKIGAPLLKPEERTADRLRAILAAKSKNAGK